ncbi:hypothetical protein PRtIB026_A36400 [Pseudomonas sp. RtIB026]|nr:hypothetical protein PRtIB026_A36400 [Pseudomonas sp. RtIB026]
MLRMGRKAAPAIFVSTLKSWGRYAALSGRSDASARPLLQGERVRPGRASLRLGIQKLYLAVSIRLRGSPKVSLP